MNSALNHYSFGFRDRCGGKAIFADIPMPQHLLRRRGRQMYRGNPLMADIAKHSNAALGSDNVAHHWRRASGQRHVTKPESAVQCMRHVGQSCCSVTAGHLQRFHITTTTPLNRHQPFRRESVGSRPLSRLVRASAARRIVWWRNPTTCSRPSQPNRRTKIGECFS